MRKLLLLLILLPEFVTGQGHTGEWRAHVSFNPVISIAETPESIVAATANGILTLDKKGAQLFTKTKSEGLAEVGIAAIAYAAAAGYLLIGYESGNLDLLQNGQIINFPDITQKSGLPDKAIHRIVCEGSFAYLCCAFGIVKVDLKKIEVAETWYFGAVNELKYAYDLTSLNNKWIVATSKGIYSADKQNINLQDYRNWKLELTLPQPEASFTSFAQMEGVLITHDQSNDRLLAWDGNKWQSRNPEIKNILHIKSSSLGMIVLTKSKIWLSSKAGNSVIDNYPPESPIGPISPSDAMTDSQGTLWIGDGSFGLTCRTSSTTYSHFLPNAPVSNKLTTLKANGADIFVATVATNSAGRSETAYSIYQEGIWQNFTAADDPGLHSILPITSFAFNKIQPDEYWASSAGTGLLHFQKSRVINTYNELNSSLGAVNGKCIVNGVAIDPQNNLCYTNSTGKMRLGSRLANGTFVTLPYPGMGFTTAPTGELLVSSSATRWVILPKEGLFAYKIKGTTENISDDLFRRVPVQTLFSNGTTSLVTQFSDISAIAEDKYNQLWVGTGTGVVVYNNPDKVFEPGEFYGTQPSLNDGEGLFKPILEKEKITSLAIDGGNRKWFGTANSGIFLFNEEGDHLLEHFNSSNSPLLSDQIGAIAISSISGEVFIATDRGLVTYKSTATEARSDYSQAYIWPNPLRETFGGVVTIDGLTEETAVRITDITGNLIYKTTSLGGRAVWNARLSNGTRVSTGVYLIFCSSPQQQSSKILKLLVIH